MILSYLAPIEIVKVLTAARLKIDTWLEWIWSRPDSDQLTAALMVIMLKVSPNSRGRYLKGSQSWSLNWSSASHKFPVRTQ